MRKLIAVLALAALVGIFVNASPAAAECATVNLTGQVTFKTNGDRNQARNGIENYIANLNAQNPQNAIGGMTSTNLMDEDDFNVVSGPWPAISLSYTLRGEVFQQVHTDLVLQMNTEVNPNNGVRNVLSLGTGCIV